MIDALMAAVIAMAHPQSPAPGGWGGAPSSAARPPRTHSVAGFVRVSPLRRHLRLPGIAVAVNPRRRTWVPDPTVISDQLIEDYRSAERKDEGTWMRSARWSHGKPPRATTVSSSPRMTG
jgi:hypothetical protein